MAEWISVEERLPIGRDALLLIDVGAGNPPHQVVGYWNRLTKSWMIGCVREYDLPVTHWQPLPEPPNAAATQRKQIARNERER